jgi:hypothetical protein
LSLIYVPTEKHHRPKQSLPNPRFSPDGYTGFAAVAIAGPDSGTPAAIPSPANEARISIEFGCGTRMTVTGAVDPMLAAGVVKALAQR